MDQGIGTQGGKIANTIIIPVIGVMLLAVVFVFAILIWSSALTDTAAEDSERNLIEGSLALQLDQLSNQQEAAAVWDDAYFRAKRGSEEAAWLLHRVAISLSQMHGHTRTAILDRNLSAIVAYDDDGAANWLDETLLTALSGPVTRVRASYIASFKKTPSGTYRFQPDYRANHRTIFENGVVLAGGRPHYFSVTAISPQTHNIGADRDAPAVLLSFVAMTPSVLGRLSGMAGIAGIEAGPVQQSRSDVASILVMDPSGQPVTRLNWRSSRPGSLMLMRILPVLVLLVLAIAAMTALLLNYARQSTRKLANSEARAIYAAQHDSLSGLPNRDYFSRMLVEALADYQDERSAKGLTAVIYIDLDHFKDINDTLGHAAGDEVIKAVTARLRTIVPPTGMLARISGDEFAMILSGCRSRSLIEYQLSHIQDELSRPLRVAGSELYVSLSMGAAIAPQDGTTAGELLRKADIALYDAKANGRRRWSFFDPAMEEHVHTRDKIARDLRRAIDNDLLSVAYQPQLDSRTGRVAAVETLVRWTQPDHGPISPAIFVPIAEETGLINDLGLWVLRRACRDAHNWPDITVSVNISPTQFRHPRFIDQVIETLSAFDVAPSRLEIEVTESVFAGKDDTVLTAMKRLKELGLKIALDDFGSGYSSLSYLRRFPFDILKIDRDFISPVDESPQAQAIVRTIIDLGAALGMTVVAEGIETAPQVQFLTSAGCERMQGYYIGRPAPVETVSALIQSISLDPMILRPANRLAG